MLLATKCPHCLTTFRVVNDQLKLHAGLVRCGNCRNTFNGIEHLVRQVSAAVQASAPATLPPNPAAIPVVPAVTAKPALPAHRIPSPVFTAPAVATVTPLPTAKYEPVPDEGLDFFFPDLTDIPGGQDERIEPHFDEEKTDLPRKPAIEAQFQAQIPDYTDTNSTRLRSKAEVDTEADTRTEITFNTPTQFDVKSEAAFKAESVTESKAETEFEFKTEPETRPATTFSSAFSSVFSSVAAAASAPPALAREPETIWSFDEAAKPANSNKNGAQHYQEIYADEHRDDDEPGFVSQARTKKRYDPLLWIACFGLLFLLFVQTIYLFRNQIAANYPASKNGLILFCNYASCKISLPAQLEALNYEADELHSLPRPDTFEFSLLLHNHSNTQQAWPSIELTLKDNKKATLLRRVFSPADYQITQQEIATGLPARQEHYIKLYFELNQATASDYVVGIFYP